MSTQLPGDILTQILARLPVKSLLRFRSVSRSWNSLITSQSFINLHLTRSVESGDDSILLSFLLSFPLLIKTVYLDNGESLTEVQKFEFPVKIIENFLYVGACNGLFCFSDFNHSPVNIILWNLSTRTCFQVPAPRSVGVSHYFHVGFGFDYQTGQYKVLRLINIVGQNHRPQITSKVEVFVLGTDRWRRVDVHVPFLVNGYTSQAFLHGAIHWIGYRPNKSVVIAIFDVHEEVFREIEIPSSITDVKSKSLSVAVYVDSLCLLEQGRWMDTEELSVWVMKQYGVKESWTKQFSIDMHDQGGLTMLGFRKHGKIIFENRNKELVSYDPKTGRLEQLGLRVRGVGSPFKAIPFTESLVMLKGAGGLEGQVSSCSSTGF